MNKKYTFLTSCVHVPKKDVDYLFEMTDNAVEITQKTFFKYVDRKEVYEMLGYSRNFPMKNEYHVSYYKSKFKGMKCYFLSWSSMEYIFTESN